MDIGIFKEKLGEKAYKALCDITAYIDCNYNMEMLYNGKNELKFQRSKKTLVTVYAEEKTLNVLIIFGKTERELFERERDGFSEYLNEYYDKSKTYHDGKWMFIGIEGSDCLGDILRMIAIKKKPDLNAVTMCGYKCGLCKAYAKNIKKEDSRKELSDIWDKYYGFRVPPEDIFCEGCRAKNNDKQMDAACPVRVCVKTKNIHSCIDCIQYPCEIFMQRKGLSCCDAKALAKESFSDDEYDKYLAAYDNRTRIDKYLKAKSNMT